jgi:hypothetical protein
VTAPYFDLPPGAELARRNRLLIADRLSWPAGTVVACEEIEQEHPGWSVWWRGENTIRGFEAPAGFYAGREDWWHGERPVYGATGTELAEKMKAWTGRTRSLD